MSEILNSFSHQDTIWYWERRLERWKEKERVAITEQDKFICRSAVKICKEQIIILQTGKVKNYAN